MPARFPRLLNRIVVLRPGEAATAWLMFIYSFLVMTAYNIVKPITRAKAINAIGAENLPYALVVAAVVIGMLMHLYGLGTGKTPRRYVVPVTHICLAGILVVFWWLFATGATWVSGAFFVFGLAFGLLLVSQFWTLANDLYDSRQAGRLFGFIGGGASLGGITGAAVTTFTVGLVGSDNLALVSASVLLLCAVTVLAILKRHPRPADDSLAEAHAPPDDRDAWSLLQHSRLLRLIALIVGVAALGAIVVEQQLNMALGEGTRSTDEITRFLGTVTMFLSIAGFAVQIGLTSRLHRRFGLAAALLLLPVALGASSLLILATSAVWAAAVARVLDTSLRYTLDRTTREVLFLPLPVDLTQRAKPFVDVTIDRLVKGLGAVLLLILIKPWGLGLTWQQLSYANMAIVASWIGLALAAHREYLETFRRNLHARAVAPAAVRLDIADAQTIALLVGELSAPDEASVLYAIDMLETAGHAEQLPPELFTHDSGTVRARALRAVLSRTAGIPEGQLKAIRRLLSDPDADVRAAAVRVIASLHDDPAHAPLRAHLDDPSAGVAAAAAVELSASAVPDDQKAAETTLARLIDVDDAAARRQAASAIGRIHNRALWPLLVPLIYDEDESVALAAIRSAGTLGAVDALLVPALVSRLGHRGLKDAATQALAGAGERVVDVLAHVMGDPHEHIWVRRHIPAVLRAIPSHRSVAALVSGLEDPDSFLRFKCLVALEGMGRTQPGLRAPDPVIEDRLLKEAWRYCELLSLKHNLVERDQDSGSSLLVAALDDKLSRNLDRLFRLLGLLHSWTDVAAARYALEHGDARQRAGALEYLDQVMSSPVRKRVMPIVDDTPVSERVRHANSVAGTRPRDIPDTLVRLFHDRDPIVGAAAVHYAGYRGWNATLGDDFRFLIDRAATPPLVREAAGWMLEAAPDAEMPTVELVNRLRMIPVFAQVPVDELFRIGGRCRWRRHQPGDAICRAGEPAAAVILLLTGSVRTTGHTGLATVTAAPAALNLAEAVVDRPVALTATVVEEAASLALDSTSLLTLLSDHSAAAQGLFRTLLGSYGELDQPTGVPAQEAVARDARDPGAIAVELGVHLRRIPLFRHATAAHLKALVAAARHARLPAGTVLWDATREAALHYLLDGEVRIDGIGRPSIVAGAGRTIGVIETLTGSWLDRRAVVSIPGGALRLDRQDLFDVLADHPDLLQGIFACVLDSGRTPGPP